MASIDSSQAITSVPPYCLDPAGVAAGVELVVCVAATADVDTGALVVVGGEVVFDWQPINRRLLRIIIRNKNSQSFFITSDTSSFFFIFVMRVNLKLCFDVSSSRSDCQV
jgi:hypothetical protein